MKKYRVVEIECGSTFVWGYYGNKKELPNAVEWCSRNNERNVSMYPYEHPREYNDNYSYEIQVQKYNKETKEWEEFKDY